MVEVSLIETLGSAGIYERVDSGSLFEGFSQAQDIMRLVKEATHESVIGIGDDYIPNTKLYNALGCIYPFLSRENKDKALHAYLTQFNGINYMRVQNNHTPYIREPLVLADIWIINPLYWPGLEESSAQVKGGENFTTFQEKYMLPTGLFNPQKTQNDFLLAYAALRSDKSTFGREYALAAKPSFLERVVKGIVAMRFGRFNYDAQRPELAGEYADQHDLLERLHTLLPVELHPQIEIHRSEGDGADPERFHR